MRLSEIKLALPNWKLQFLLPHCMLWENVILFSVLSLCGTWDFPHERPTVSLFCWDLDIFGNDTEGSCNNYTQSNIFKWKNYQNLCMESTLEWVLTYIFSKYYHRIVIIVESKNKKFLGNVGFTAKRGLCHKVHQVMRCTSGNSDSLDFTSDSLPTNSAFV